MRYSIVIRIGSGDNKKVRLLDTKSKVVDVPFLNNILSADKRVKHEYVFDGLNRLGLKPSHIAIDLLNVAVGVLSSDTRINREKESDDSWVREIDLYIPVSDPKIWNMQKDRIAVILRFLTGDRWTISFRGTAFNYNELFKNKKKKEIAGNYDGEVVSLFSGGMDSFIGAIDLIEGKDKPLLVGHRKSVDVGGPQRKAYEYLKQQYNNAVEYFPIRLSAPKKIFAGDEEKTERGRSFVFLALGILAASSLKGNRRLIIPENGLISLNVPLSPLRLGALSTRTTHPYYILRFQQLIDALKLNISLENPYRFLTKGEMLASCTNQNNLKTFISETMSCAHPAAGRFRKEIGVGHCGLCVPCVIRRAAFHKAQHLINDLTDYKRNISSIENKEYIYPFLRSIKRLKDKPGIEKLLIFKAGPLFDYSSELNNYSDVYRRGMEEIDVLFKSLKIN
ncbi:MAG: hypothetical protein A2Y03_00565 [Omnitrophica WOR_2 bacterium GWF2_38_59]|nr:MAG: hypothetical protein A2Y03_00565 [Omnitrophica WOR_2 bacterium GWF2_38_59]OGX49530.1 MAG: hypothetical protein A2243_10640 [Omnitrophica WOR_2 bacterium RIFOXYA2_FULL_38_17]OGX58726.1 MAG: hypothetical protein A2306_12265 [Omnitrophica WOR_2 bacterium RIFOXYB2_FULL_38_16]HBG62165.1 hypothetical protein [Candidatus Omnitrophota bacterium]